MHVQGINEDLVINQFIYVLTPKEHKSSRSNKHQDAVFTQTQLIC